MRVAAGHGIARQHLLVLILNRGDIAEVDGAAGRVTVAENGEFQVATVVDEEVRIGAGGGGDAEGKKCASLKRFKHDA
jgi:hypothetical protein